MPLPRAFATHHFGSLSSAEKTKSHARRSFTSLSEAFLFFTSRVLTLYTWPEHTLLAVGFSRNSWNYHFEVLTTRNIFDFHGRAAKVHVANKSKSAELRSIATETHQNTVQFYTSQERNITS